MVNATVGLERSDATIYLIFLLQLGNEFALGMNKIHSNTVPTLALQDN